jgi:hypothetical protein
LQFKGAEVTPAVELPEIARVGALTLGYLRDLVIGHAFRVGVGGDLTSYRFPEGLKPPYGDSPISAHVFLRVRWGKPHGSMDHSGMTMGGSDR